jgi:hypothetical protein
MVNTENATLMAGQFWASLEAQVILSRVDGGVLHGASFGHAQALSGSWELCMPDGDADADQVMGGKVVDVLPSLRAFDRKQISDPAFHVRDTPKP